TPSLRLHGFGNRSIYRIAYKMPYAPFKKSSAPLPKAEQTPKYVYSLRSVILTDVAAFSHRSVDHDAGATWLCDCDQEFTICFIIDRCHTQYRTAQNRGQSSLQYCKVVRV